MLIFAVFVFLVLTGRIDNHYLLRDVVRGNLVPQGLLVVLNHGADLLDVVAVEFLFVLYSHLHLFVLRFLGAGS